MSFGAIAGAVLPTVIGGAVSTIGGAILSKSASKRQEKYQRKSAEAQYAAMQESNRIMQEAAGKAGAAISGGAGQAASAIMAGAKKQAGAILERSGMAIGAQEKYWAVADKKLEPFRKIGENAGIEMASMMGIPGPDGQLRPYDVNKLRQTPGYEFVFGEGQRAVERSAAGKKLSGQQIKDQTQYGQKMGDKYFQRQFENLNTLNRTGLEAGQTLASLAVRTGEGIAQTHRWAGQNLSDIYGAEASGLASAAMAGGHGAAGAIMQGAQGEAQLARMRGEQTASMYEQRASQPSLGQQLGGLAIKGIGAAIDTGARYYGAKKDVGNLINTRKDLF